MIYLRSKMEKSIYEKTDRQEYQATGAWMWVVGWDLHIGSRIGIVRVQTMKCDGGCKIQSPVTKWTITINKIL